MTLTLDDAETLRATPREERARVCREALASARAEIAARHAAGASGEETSRAWAHAVDAVVRALLAAADGAKEIGALTLAAVGGYGRGELCPGSDLDLWFITPRPADQRVLRLAEEVLYPLWDLRLDVGHAVRSIDDSVALARDDLSAATALLDMRLVAGDAAQFATLEREARKRVFDREPLELVRRLAVEKTGRHARFGDTLFLLEPDVKNGQGAYRDLLVSLWAAKARFRVADFADLLPLGQATERQVRQLEAARGFFLRVRTAAHLFARRRQDRLLFEIQEAIAPQLCAGDGNGNGRVAIPPPLDSLSAQVRPSVAPAPPERSEAKATMGLVEELMRTYYLHAKAVQREGARLLERCVAEPTRKAPRVTPVDESFVLWNGLLSTRAPEVFRERPAEMVRVFRVALDREMEIHGHTKELIAEACSRATLVDELAADPAAARDFQALLVDDRDARSPSLLEQMHELGLLAALLPEFAPCTARVQHDLYHVFTVDQHSLYAVGRLKALARGELAAELPVASDAMKQVQRKLPLYLGTLLHDVGKPLGKGHSETGARLAQAIGRRLRLVDEDVAHVEFLVRKHLLLAHLSQRRDLNDVAMIANLATEMLDERTLRDLYLLTLADMSMVSPDNLTAWKEQLLRELYTRALSHLRRGPDLAGIDRSTVVLRRKARAAALLGEPEERLASWYAGLPDRYFTQTAPRDIARHAQLSRRREAGGRPFAVDVSHRQRKGWSELTVVAADAPGLLARIAGALWASKVDVLSAQITSRQPDEAIDVFVVRDRYGRAVSPERATTLVRDLERVLGGELAVEALIAERRERSSLKARVTPHVPTEIEIDNDVSADFTVVDVYTQDRPGVLYAITHTLSQLGLDIHLSKVATEADRVADVFYVRAANGNKLPPDSCTALRDALVAALGRGQDPGS